jgi:hypothetical protein
MPGPPCQRNVRRRTRPSKIGAHSRDASISAEYENVQRTRAVISSAHVRHVGRDARAHYFACFYHVAHDGRYNHVDQNYPDKSISRLQWLQSHKKARE